MRKQTKKKNTQHVDKKGSYTGGGQRTRRAAGSAELGNSTEGSRRGRIPGKGRKNRFKLSDGFHYLERILQYFLECLGKISAT